jgi:tetratricopeptide (TPR) repeat protein
MNAVNNFKKPLEVEAEVKKSFTRNEYERSIYDIMGSDGSFTRIKEYNKAGAEHLLYRISGKGGFTYVDFELAKLKGYTGIGDMLFYNTGENLSSSLSDLMFKLENHGKESTTEMLESNLTELNRYLQEAEYSKARIIYERLPYDLRNNRLYEMRYIDMLSHCDKTAYLKQLETMEKKYGADPGFQLMMIDVNFMHEDWDKTMASVNVLDSVINKDPYLDFYRGIIYEKKNEPAKAAKAFENVLKVYPQMTNVLAELLMMYPKTGQKEKARAYFALYKKSRDAQPAFIKYYASLYPDIAK